MNQRIVLMRNRIVFLLVLALFSSASPVNSVSAGDSALLPKGDDPFASKEERIADEILIKFKGDSSITRFRFPATLPLAKALRALQANPRVEHVEPHYMFRIAASQAQTNDPLLDKQSFLDAVHVPEAWALTTGSTQVTVAVLDSGVDIHHPDLRNNIWTNSGEIPGDGIDNDQNGYIDDMNGWDFVDGTPDPTPKFNGPFVTEGIHHGTIIAGIIAAQGNNPIGVAGVSWRSKIMPLRVLNNEGEGEVIMVVNAIDYLIKKKVDIINLSFVGSGESQFLKAALKRAYDAGIIIVSASGNDETVQHGFDLAERPVYPACFDYGKEDIVVGVGSVDPLGQKAEFSNYGPCIDVSAPGIDFFSTQTVRYDEPGFEDFYGGGWSGTSLSTALVSGAFALVKSANPHLTPSDAIKLLKSSCTPLDGLNEAYKGKLGCGLLDVGRLVRLTVERGHSSNNQNDSLVLRPNTLAITTADGKKPLLFFEGMKQKSNRQLFPFDPSRVPFIFSGSDGRSGVFAAALGEGRAPFVRIFDRDLKNLSQFAAYDQKFRGGVSVAVADVDGDGEDEIITAPGRGGGPHVKIFDLFGTLKVHFLAYPASYRGGLSVAAGDLNNDGRREIIVTPLNASKGIMNEIRIFNGNGKLLTKFFAYPNTTVSRIAFAVGDLDGDGFLEIVTSPLTSAGAVRIFSSTGILQKSFNAFPKELKLPVTLVLGDINVDGKDEIIIAPARMAGPHIRIFDSSARMVAEFFAFDKNKRFQLRLGVIR